MSEKSIGSEIRYEIGCDEVDRNTVDDQQINEELIWVNEQTPTKSPILRPDKRSRNEVSDKEDENGFVTVRKQTKRLARSYSQSANKPENLYEISMTSKEPLPKQIGLAKFMRSLNIPNIIKIKYKNPYKVLIQLNTRFEAEKLLNSEKIKEMGYRCQSTHENNLSYGIVKQVELEVSEQEIQEAFKCDAELISVKRLKRQTDKGDWTDSETVRLCFNSETLPPYVYGYGCRFKIEPYIFPVTQCSKCWKFGHYIRNCPTNKTVCPKCGGNHVNCDTHIYKCINCKGPHMSLDKSCSVFVKEKEIRYIMSRKNYTYRKALEHYLEIERNKHSQINLQTNEENLTRSQPIVTYRDVVMQDNEQKSRYPDSSEVYSDSEANEKEKSTNSKKTRKRKKKKKQNKTNSGL